MLILFYCISYYLVFLIHHFNSVCDMGPLSEVPYFLFPCIMVILIMILCGIFLCRNHCGIITRNSEYLSSDQPSKSYSKLQVIYMYICIIIWTVIMVTCNTLSVVSCKQLPILFLY